MVGVVAGCATPHGDIKNPAMFVGEKNYDELVQLYREDMQPIVDKYSEYELGEMCWGILDSIIQDGGSHNKDASCMKNLTLNMNDQSGLGCDTYTWGSILSVDASLN